MVQGKVRVKVRKGAVWDKLAVHLLQIGVREGQEIDGAEDPPVVPPVEVPVRNASGPALIVDGCDQPVSGRTSSSVMSMTNGEKPPICLPKYFPPRNSRHSQFAPSKQRRTRPLLFVRGSSNVRK